MASHNILLAIEILSNFKLTRKQWPFYVNFDIFKAFNTVSRELFLHRIKLKGFSNRFIFLDQSMYIRHSFLFLNQWKHRGIFQFLFQDDIRLSFLSQCFLYSDGCLHATLENVIQDYFFYGLCISMVNISHMLYANYIFMFGKAFLSTMFLLKNILNIYNMIFDLNINHSRSSIMFSNPFIKYEKLYDVFNLPRETSSYTYLGILYLLKGLTSQISEVY